MTQFDLTSSFLKQHCTKSQKLQYFLNYLVVPASRCKIKTNCLIRLYIQYSMCSYITLFTSRGRRELEKGNDGNVSHKSDRPCIQSG